MSYMKNLDLSERFSKLSEAQKNAVINIMSGGTEKIHPATYKALESRELIVKSDEAWELEKGFKTEIMEAINRPEPRETDGDFTPENIARAIQEIDDEYDNHPMMTPEQEQSVESVEEDAPVPFFNRAARRAFRRNIARFNRSVMRLHGKRTKRFGPNVVIKHAA